MEASTMTMRLGVVMDPIANIKPYKDTTFLMLLAAQKRGYQLFYMQPEDLFIDHGQATASMRPLTVTDSTTHWFALGESSAQALTTLDSILMRKEPPFDAQFLYSTQILELAHRAGTLVANSPQALRDYNEKLFAAEFPECCPPFIVTQQEQLIKDFYQRYRNIILKPLDGMGGQGVFHCTPEEKNLNVIIELLSNNGQQSIMAQEFIPAINKGDKRILIVDGQVIPYSLARVPMKGETRGNLAAGGQGIVQALTERDQWIAEQIADTLVDKGILFAGIDVIGDYLTEINITSPTCAREIDNAYNTDIGGKLMDAIEKRIHSH